MSQRRRVARAVPRLGVIGAARIVKKALLPAAPGLVEVVAVAAREQVRARAFADEHGIVDAHGSYAELLSRSDLDAVYIALPAALHARWTLAALAAGKHVLCEKPFGLHASEAEACVGKAAETGLLLMEAHHWRYHPLVPAFVAALAEVGPIERVEVTFDAPIRAGNIRLDPALGAGVLLDFGCYAVQWLALAAGDDEPEIVEASAIEAGPGVDVAFRARLRSAAGANLSFSCDMRPETTFKAYIDVVGQGGRIHFDNPLNGEDARLSILSAGRSVRLEAPGPSTYRGQLQAFVRALGAGTDPETSGASVVRTQAMLDGLYRAAGLPDRAAMARIVSAGGPPTS